MARRAMPEPTPERDAVDVVIDRTVSDVPLSKGAFTQGDGAGFGLLEQWIPRLGYFTSRRQGPDVFSGDALVVLCPTGSISPEYREQLVEYVSGGGKLVVFDAPYNRGSTANSLLRPFGLAMDHETTPNGELTVGKDATGIKVDAACQVTGGQNRSPRSAASRSPPAFRTARARSRRSDSPRRSTTRRWASTGCKCPTRALRKRYDVLFGLLRGAVEGR